MDTHDANWWTFQLEKADDDLLMPEMCFLPLPPHERPRRDISYATYLEIEKVLSAQRPLSRAPDERAFIVVHQIFELTFKLMLFDLAVIERALWGFVDLGRRRDNKFRQMLFPPEPSTGGNVFTKDVAVRSRWIAAVTASNRLKHSAETLLPAYLGLITGELPPSYDNRLAGHEAPTFDSEQFRRFRSRVPPASGFQSAQFRALQRVLGKAPLLDVAYFDMHLYARNYHQQPPEARMPPKHTLVRVDDELVLRDEATVARPAKDSPAGWAQQLEGTTLELLGQIAKLMNLEPASSKARDIEAEKQDVIGSFKMMIRPGENSTSVAGPVPADIGETVAREWAEVFAKDLTTALSMRKESFEARAAFAWLEKEWSHHPIVHCIHRVHETDELLFGKQNPFLQHHHATAVAAGLPETDTGSAGGGHAFLTLSTALNGLFPALSALW